MTAKKLTKTAIMRLMGGQVICCRVVNAMTVDDVASMRDMLAETAAAQGFKLEEYPKHFAINTRTWMKPVLHKERTGVLSFKQPRYCFQYKDPITGEMQTSYGLIADIVVPATATEDDPSFEINIRASKGDGTERAYLEYSLVDECKVAITDNPKYRTEGNNLYEFSKGRGIYVLVLTSKVSKGKDLIEEYEAMV